ncbi:MAG: NTP transferase domain-containing protein [Actinomycetota bacterium]|nr:NTP transferase domain-containing protein [Actinomycetota bacterium]
MPRTVAVVLANDPGSGFTGSKYLSDVGGITLIDRSLADASVWPVDEVIVVLGPEAEDIAATLGSWDVIVVIDPEWEEGSAASLRVGLDVVMRGPATDLVVVAHADQPGVAARDISALLEATDDAAVVVPKYRYRRGFPIVLARETWEHLLGLEGDVDLLGLLESHPEGVAEVWFDHLEAPRIGCPEDITGR